MIESPDTVHGRLLESVRLAGYTFERACAELEWLLIEDRWKGIVASYRDVNAFLDTIDWSHFRIAIEQRKGLAKRLADAKANVSATARLLGVDEGTIRTDLGKRSGKRSDKSESVIEITPKNTDQSQNHSDKSEWFQSDIDPAQAAKQHILKQQAIARKREGKRIPDGPYETDAYRIIPGDCTTVTLTDRVDWIITDPPYGRDALPLYADLGRFAVENLKEGGSCLVMTGQLCLPEVIAELSRYLSYQWLLTWMMPGGQPTQIWPRKISCFWKPIIWMVNGPYQGDHVITDVIQNAANDREKDHHHWGQSEAGFAHLIDTFTIPDDRICDPFCGGGTTGAAAVRLRRKFIGIDADRDAVDTTRQRLATIVEEETACYEKSNSQT